MKKIVLLATAALLLLAGTAMAESIAGKFGGTLRGGAGYVFDSEWKDWVNPARNNIKADTAWTGGGGIMYGINENIALNFDVIYLQTDLKAGTFGGFDRKIGTAKTVDFSLGAQWRFIPKSHFVPYVGAGFDVMWNDFTADSTLTTNSVKVDVTYGGHLNAGADFFITPNIAFNAEVRGLYSTKGDMKVDSVGSAMAEYNPTNISGFLGIRFFFP
jgi:outer membrane protein